MPAAAPYVARLEWVSASDLAEYAYCPRARWYAHHPPSEGPDPDTVFRRAAGVSRHRATARAIRRREASLGFWWALLLAGLALAIGIAVAGLPR